MGISACGGAITLGTWGGSVGTTAGAIVGGAVGIVPALFTCGLSIPAGAVAGGMFGGSAGIILGSGTGVIAGGVAGNFAYIYRVEIKRNAVFIKTKVVDKTENAQSAFSNCATSVQDKAQKCYVGTMETASKVSQRAASKASALRTGIKKAASEPRVQVTAVSAGGGSMVGGSTGLATGA